MKTLLVMGLKAPQLFLYKDVFGIKYPMNI